MPDHQRDECWDCPAESMGHCEGCDRPVCGDHGVGNFSYVVLCSDCQGGVRLAGQ